MSDQTPPPFPNFGKPLEPAAPATPADPPSMDAPTAGGDDAPVAGPYGSAAPAASGFGTETAAAPSFGSDPYAQADPYAAPTDPYAQSGPYSAAPADPYAASDPYAAGGYGASAGYGAPSYDPGAPPAAGAYAPVPYQPTYGSAPYSAAAYGMAPSAPFGVDPVTGIPYSEKSKLVAGLLGIFLGSFGVGRFYLGNIGMGIAQILVTGLTLGIGAIWPLIDGIMILAGSPKDANGRPLRP